MARTYYETKFRRVLARRGLLLEKSGRRSPNAEGWGKCRVVDAAGNSLTEPGHRLTLEEAAAWAERFAPRQRNGRSAKDRAGAGGADWVVLAGDALERLREWDDGSHQCCVTSPPY